MSLKPFSAHVVPERTASVARRAFPAGSLCIRIFDELGTIFQDQDFADLYSQHGQPGQPPFRLALVTVLQFIEGLSDGKACSISMNFRRACARHFASTVSFWPLQFAASASDIWIGLPNSALRAFNNSPRFSPAWRRMLL